MAALLALYLVFAVQYGVVLIGVGTPIGYALGIALLVFPVIAAGALAAELVLRHARRPARSDSRGRGGASRRRPAAAPERSYRQSAADAVFPRFQQDAEAHPDDWRAWYRLGLAYDACGDRRRARWATRIAVKKSR